MKAIWNNTVIAESNDTIVVEGNHYFPESAINKDHFKPSNYTTFCGWKGTASYYSVEVNGQLNENAAWYYAEPMEKAQNIKNYVAFWRGVEVVGDSEASDLTDGMKPEDLVC